MKKVIILLLLFSFNYSQTFNTSKGWEMFGSAEDINDLSIFDNCIETIYVYKSGKWDNYPNGNTKILKSGQGFWLKGKKDCIIDTKKSANNPISSSKPNILLIIADDVGLDASLGYDIGSIKPKMNNVQNLIDNGITFNNVWASALCTPTRTNIITGKYASTVGMLNVGDELSVAEVSLQAYISNSYKTAVIGKWHLSSDPSHPDDMEVGYYAGLLSGGTQSYNRWKLTQNETTTISKEYITTKFTDLSIDWLNEQKKQNNPWFLWLAYTSAHTPFHLPPANLHTQNLSGEEQDIKDNPRKYYMAMLEAMDTEIGRLLSSLDEQTRNNTIIIFIGDNGTPNEVRQEYGDKKVKGSIYEGGIHIPMIISGAGVSRKNEKENALINISDLYATIANISGINIENIHNSKNFSKLLSNKNTDTRKYIYAEVGKKSGKVDVAVRNKDYKYILFGNKTEAFYDLRNDLLEEKNIINNLSSEQEKVKDELLLYLAKATE